MIIGFKHLSLTRTNSKTFTFHGKMERNLSFHIYLITQIIKINNYGTVNYSQSFNIFKFLIPSNSISGPDNQD